MSFTYVAEPIEAVKERLGDFYEKVVLNAVEFRGELTLYIKPENLVECSRILRDPYDLLADLTAVDNLNDRKEGEPRFYVVYNLFSTKTKHRIRLKSAAEGDPPSIDTVTTVWSAANWHERECFDMFGIHFRGHPDMRRILMPEDWEGHPLRKDYPVADQEPYEYINKQLADE